MHAGSRCFDRFAEIVPRRGLDPDILVIPGERDQVLDGVCCSQLLIEGGKEEGGVTDPLS